MVLVDTNVVVALWVQSDRTDRARRLLERDPDWRTEAFALIEFANVRVVLADQVFFNVPSDRGRVTFARIAQARAARRCPRDGSTKP